MKLLTERLYLDAPLLDYALLLGMNLVVAMLLCVETLLCDPNCHIKVCDLVGILARCWNFDWTCPVEVEVAQRVGQRLQLNLRQ